MLRPKVDELFGRVVIILFIAFTSLTLFAGQLAKLFNRNLLAPTNFTINYSNFRPGQSTALVEIGMSF